MRREWTAEEIERMRAATEPAGAFFWSHDHWEHVAPDYYGDPDVVLLFCGEAQMRAAKGTTR